MITTRYTLCGLALERESIKATWKHVMEVMAALDKARLHEALDGYPPETWPDRLGRERLEQYAREVLVKMGLPRNTFVVTEFGGTTE